MSERTNVRGRRRDAWLTLTLYLLAAILVVGSLYAAFGWRDPPDLFPACHSEPPCDLPGHGGGTFLVRLFGGMLVLPFAALLYLAARGGEPVRTLRRRPQADSVRAHE